MTGHHLTFSEVASPFDARDLGPASVTPMESVVERLRSVRLKVGRWLPGSDLLSTLNHDHADIFQAATRLDSSVQELDAYMAEHPDDADAPAFYSMTLQLLLCNVEERAEDFERSVIEGFAAGN